MKAVIYAIFEIPAYLCLRSLIAVLNFLPLNARISLLSGLGRLIVTILPRYREVALRNMELAFPDKDINWRRDLLGKSYTEMARTVVDFARLGQIDLAWINQNVEQPLGELFARIRKESPDRGILIATGHLGSFELLAHVAPLVGYPISFVFRDFNMRLISKWWRSVREANGNRSIPRKGAFAQVLSELNAGRNVALLFDQNVTRNHAVFVPMFGRLAATSKSVALAALRTGANMMVVGIRYVGNGRYCIDAIECPYRDLAINDALTSDQKVAMITERATKILEGMILKYPEGWFWMHRRWKTTPKEGDAKFYH